MFLSQSNMTEAAAARELCRVAYALFWLDYYCNRRPQQKQASDRASINTMLPGLILRLVPLLVVASILSSTREKPLGLLSLAAPTPVQR